MAQQISKHEVTTTNNTPEPGNTITNVPQKEQQPSNATLVVVDEKQDEPDK